MGRELLVPYARDLTAIGKDTYSALAAIGSGANFEFVSVLLAIG
jgi:hypothetical protein